MFISDREYKQLAQLIHDQIGIALGEEKRALLLNRLNPLMLQQGFRSFDEYYQQLQSDVTGQALATLANRITTNYSFFFRESEHLNFLRQYALPQRIQSSAPHKEAPLNIWSAGCAAGEEAYSLAMALHAFFQEPLSQWDLGVLATDIDTNMLEKAYHGVYAEEHLRNIPASIRTRYFKPKPPGMWEIKAAIRKYVHFSRFNLIQSHFPFKKKFFAIFCRNVMIYFDRATAKQLVQQLYDVTEDQGYLFISLTETLDRDDCPYHYVAPSIYQKRI